MDAITKQVEWIKKRGLGGNDQLVKMMKLIESQEHAIAEKDREIEQLKAQRLGIDTQRIEARCLEFASDPDNYECRDEKLEMGDYINVEKLVALYNEAIEKGYRQALTEKERELQQIREHEFQNGYREGEAAAKDALAEKEREVAKWKAAHDEMVARNRLL